VEARYPQLDIEALAIDFGLRRFRFYIVGGPQATIITDHKPLESIFKNIRKGSIRTDRIKLRHQDVNYTVKWEPGADNIADYMSRHPVPWKNTPTNIKKEAGELEKNIWYLQFNPYVEALSIKKLVEESEKDRVLGKLRKALQKGKIDGNDGDMAPYKNIDQLTITESGLIMKKEKIILPENMVATAISKAHQGGHPGINSMKRRIRSHFYHPQLNKKIEAFLKRCKLCAMFNPINRKHKLHAQTLKDVGVWDKISLDLFGPMPCKSHILVAQDMTSKFPAAKII